jgi:murein DD-endopeptidase MepM/ murein hydrolase activator NlpD
LLVALGLGGCKKEEAAPALRRDGSLGAQRCSGRPGPKNHLSPVLQRPFDGQYPVYRLFDHELPEPRAVDSKRESDTELTYCGLVALGLDDGSPGYAFGLPMDTPVLSAAEGEVTSAGAKTPWACARTHRIVDDEQWVEVRHDGLGGVGYLTRYSALSKVLVNAGDKVVAGQRLGLSGQSACARLPALEFAVLQLTATKTGRPAPVDPYGWDGPGPDPWAESEHGVRSDYLWIDAEAPTLKSSK